VIRSSRSGGKQTRKVRGLAVVATASFILMGLAQTGAADPQDLATRALEFVAIQQGIPIEQLTIGQSDQSHLPLTGVDLADFKVMALDGRSFGVSFDTAAEEVVDPSAAEQDEADARAATYGVLDPALYDRLQQLGADRIPVAIWVAMENPGM
jgi:hypothetical protein